MNNITEKNINEKIICPNCASLIDANSIVCYVCNGLISNSSTIDPVQNVYEQGRMYRNLAKSKPKFVVLLGTWVMFFPSLLFSAGFAIYLLLTGIGTGFISFIGFWFLLLLAYASFVFLFRVTRNYFALAPREADEWD